MTSALDAQRKVAERAEELASEVEVDLTVPRAAEQGLSPEASRKLIRQRYRSAIEALGRV